MKRHEGDTMTENEIETQSSVRVLMPDGSIVDGFVGKVPASSLREVVVRSGNPGQPWVRSGTWNQESIANARITGQPLIS
jgi:hypothetical protein